MRGSLARLIFITVLSVAIQSMAADMPKEQKLSGEMQATLLLIQKDYEVAQANVDKWTVTRDGHQKSYIMQVDLFKAKLGLDDSWDYIAQTQAFAKKLTPIASPNPQGNKELDK